MTTGDMLLLPFTAEHRFWNGKPPEFAFAPDIVRPGADRRRWRRSTTAAAARKRASICGYLELSEFLFTPVFRTLPSDAGRTDRQ